MSHGHGHGHGGASRCHGDDDDHEEPPERRGQAWGLYLRIDRERLECLNERREGSGALVFRAWEDRGDRQKFVESDDDEELLFNIPFTGNVKLKGIIVMGEDDDTHPSEMRLFKNIPHMSFDNTAREPDQMFSLNRDTTGELEYPTKHFTHYLSRRCPGNLVLSDLLEYKEPWRGAMKREEQMPKYPTAVLFCLSFPVSFRNSHFAIAVIWDCSVFKRSSSLDPFLQKLWCRDNKDLLYRLARRMDRTSPTRGDDLQLRSSSKPS